MKMFYEWGIRQLKKKGEELCGDSVGVSGHPDSVMLALSDGLGSGVKANILATLTTRIAMHMLENDLSIGDVVEALGETLPVCNVRNMAYSTFAIAQFFPDGHARVVEFDSPLAMLLRNRKIHSVDYEERSIEEKTIYESVVDLAYGDWIMFVSDGVLNAGIGGKYPLGWGWDQAARFFEKNAHPDRSAQNVADRIAQAVAELYNGYPGDDVSVVVIKARKEEVATVLTGPPADRAADKELVDRFLQTQGKRIVCGGTTAKIVSRCSGLSLDVDLDTMTAEVPAYARIEDMDLVTEGILTLTKVNELLQEGAKKEDIKFRTDGASELLRYLLSADHVHFIVGKAVNPAHQNPELPRQLEMRLSVVREIAEKLRDVQIEVSLESV